jgi:glycosyltransferase involved in cell wall biosynthesis
LDSVVSQTYSDMEVVIIDGLSTDRTMDIAARYAASFPYISYVSEKDKGIYDAMNKGIKLAKGEWVYFMGSDDTFYSKDVVEAALSGDLSSDDVIYGDVFSNLLGGVYDGEFTVGKLFNKNICHQAIFFRKSIFRRTGLFDTRFKAHADWLHNLKWFADRRIRKRYVNKIIANFSEGGISSVHKDVFFEHVMNWKRANHYKKEASRINRLRMAKAILKEALVKNYTRQFFKVIAGIPAFIFLND